MCLRTAPLPPYRRKLPPFYYRDRAYEKAGITPPLSKQATAQPARSPRTQLHNTETKHPDDGDIEIVSVKRASTPTKTLTIEPALPPLPPNAEVEQIAASVVDYLEHSGHNFSRLAYLDSFWSMDPSKDARS